MAPVSHATTKRLVITSEADGQCVALMGLRAEGFGLNSIHQRQDDEVEHAAAEHIAQRDVRQRGECRGAEPGEQLRKARRRGEQDDADPASTQSRLLSEHVPVSRQARAGENNDERGLAANWTQIIPLRSACCRFAVSVAAQTCSVSAGQVASYNMLVTADETRSRQ